MDMMVAKAKEEVDHLMMVVMTMGTTAGTTTDRTAIVAQARLPNESHAGAVTMEMTMVPVTTDITIQIRPRALTIVAPRSSTASGMGPRSPGRRLSR